LRIAIDATPLTVPAGGIRRYVVELTRALGGAFPQDEIHLLSDQNFQAPAPLHELRNVVTGGGLGKGIRRHWWSVGLPWELERRRIDVFHGADFSIPYLPVRPSVLVIHDLSPWKTPQAGSERVRRRTPLLLPLATKIITPTEAVRQELAARFGVPDRQVSVTHLAAADAFRPRPPEEAQAVLERRKIRGPYVLALGSGAARKNLGTLALAWSSVREACPPMTLVAAGEAGSGAALLESTAGLQQCGYIPDEELAVLLSAARAFVYPSLYEGFGLPVLEAMSSGTPVITSNDPAVREVAGGAALHADVTSARELSGAIVEVLTNSGLRARLIKKGADRASALSWRSTAVSTRAVYEQAIRRF